MCSSRLVASCGGMLRQSMPRLTMDCITHTNHKKTHAHLRRKSSISIIALWGPAAETPAGPETKPAGSVFATIVAARALELSAGSIEGAAAMILEGRLDLSAAGETTPPPGGARSSCSPRRARCPSSSPSPSRAPSTGRRWGSSGTAQKETRTAHRQAYGCTPRWWVHRRPRCTRSRHRTRARWRRTPRTALYIN